MQIFDFLSIRIMKDERKTFPRCLVLPVDLCYAYAVDEASGLRAAQEKALKAGMGCMKRWFCVLAVLLLVCLCGLAAGENGWGDWCSNHIAAEAFIDGGWVKLDQHMLYSHEHGVMADGILMFESFPEFIEKTPIQEAELTEDFEYRITADSYIDEYKYWEELFREEDGQLWWLTDMEDEEAIDLKETPLNALEPGRYLLSLQFSASHDGEEYAGLSFLWITIK